MGRKIFGSNFYSYGNAIVKCSVGFGVGDDGWWFFNIHGNALVDPIKIKVRATSYQEANDIAYELLYFTTALINEYE
jgi:hypothetical protein